MVYISVSNKDGSIFTRIIYHYSNTPDLSFHNLKEIADITYVLPHLL